jgi:flavodoxin-like protein
MRALVVYESMFGNTKSLALAIADGVRTSMEVSAVEVADAPSPLPPDVDLLIVGGPTHAHGLTSPNSRANAAERAGIRLVSRGSGIREWLEALSPGSHEIAATAFDTRIKGPELLTGSAAKGAAKRLKGLGFRLMPVASFVISGATGEPFDRLPAEELERARAWGASLGTAVGGALVGASR